MTEEYYKIYGEKSGLIVIALIGDEKGISKICDKINTTSIINEKLTYGKIDIKQYQKITESLRRRSKPRTLEAKSNITLAN